MIVISKPYPPLSLLMESREKVAFDTVKRSDNYTFNFIYIIIIPIPMSLEVNPEKMLSSIHQSNPAKSTLSPIPRQNHTIMHHIR